MTPLCSQPCKSGTTRPSRRHAAARGFTLIEMLIVVAIIGILAAVAYPSYTEHVNRGRRAQAQTELLEAAQYMQRFYAANNRFDVGMDGAGPTLPSAVSPREGTAAYDIAITDRSLGATTYTLQAAPRGPMTGDRCGTLTLTHLGVKGVTGAAANVAAADCWR